MSVAGKSLLTGSLTLLFFVFWFVVLRPTALGGSATYIIISGTSMEPTYSDGDLVVVGVQDHYAIGDVVAYRVDDYYVNERFIIHRIVDGDRESGFTTRGDNRDEIDPWSPTPSEIVGGTFLHVPYLGHLFAFLRQNPGLFAATAGTVTALSLFQFRARKEKRRRRQIIRERRARRRRPSLSTQLKV